MQKIFSYLFCVHWIWPQLWGSTLPVIVLTDNKSITRFFQTKIIPPTLWNVCEYVLQYNFVIAHIPNEPKWETWFRVSRRHTGRTNRCEYTIISFAEAKQLYIEPNDSDDEERLWEFKRILRDKTKSVQDGHKQAETKEIQQYHQPTAGTYQHKFGHFKDNAVIRIEQNNDQVLRNLRALTEKQPVDKNKLNSDFRYSHFLNNMSRLKVRREVLTRKYYDDTCLTSHNQFLLHLNNCWKNSYTRYTDKVRRTRV